MTNEQAWNFAIGIVQIDGIKPSDFFLDLVEKEKALFEWPQGLDADRITGWISGWFGCTAQRVGARTWVV